MNDGITDEQCKEIAWQAFCNAHPVEAYAYNPDGFWKYFHIRTPQMTREQMVALLKECEEPAFPVHTNSGDEPGATSYRCPTVGGDLH